MISAHSGMTQNPLTSELPLAAVLCIVLEQIEAHPLDIGWRLTYSKLASLLDGEEWVI